PQGVTGAPRTPVSSQEGTEGGKGNESSQGKGRAGKLERLADGVYMTAIEQRAFRDDYGDDLFLDIPDKVSEWAIAQGIEVKNGYKMCCQFADKEVKRGKAN
ncbi:MAG TPA: hypothetical protein PKI15_11165, partial [Candidatus Cloacimonadota bacterium]|nr:hypothetical protein [Candidatus Cloacimonadota bacterium]